MKINHRRLQASIPTYQKQELNFQILNKFILHPASLCYSYPVCILEGPYKEVDQPGDGSVLPERGVIGRTEGQVTDEANDRLNEGPAGWRVHEADNGG